MQTSRQPVLRMIRQRSAAVNRSDHVAPGPVTKEATVGERCVHVSRPEGSGVLPPLSL